LLVISKYSRPDFVDNSLTDQSSVVKFIEENWFLPALGNGATDASAGSLDLMFDFNGDRTDRLFLNPDGTVAGGGNHNHH
jgi:phospholipase C